MSKRLLALSASLLLAVALVGCSDDGHSLSPEEDLALFTSVDVEILVVPLINAMSTIPGLAASNGAAFATKGGGPTNCTSLGFCESGIGDECDEGVHFDQCEVAPFTLDGLVPYTATEPDCGEMVFTGFESWETLVPDRGHLILNGTLTVCGDSPPRSETPFHIFSSGSDIDLSLDFNGGNIVPITATNVNNDVTIACTLNLSNGSVSC